jgi:hypothetical protein
MASSWENCLRCDKPFLGNAKNCPECRAELKAQKEADKKALLRNKPIRPGQKAHSLKMDNTKEKVCLSCGKTFTANRRWLIYPDYCSNGCRKQVSKIQLKS